MRLSDDARKCVAYLGFYEGSVFQPLGTGFFLTYGNPSTTYLVTAAHVAKDLSTDHFVIRLNDSSGDGGEEEINDCEWQTHQDETVDIAVLEYRPPSWADYVPWPGHAIATEVKLHTKNLGAGDLAYVVGVYRLLHGKSRNMPIVHTGHIALMPGNEPIPTHDWNAADPKNAELIHVNGYLIEVSTLPAISGAPVFARRSIQVGIGGDPSADQEHADAIKSWVYGTVWLLGVWHGAWMGDPSDLLKELMLNALEEY